VWNRDVSRLAFDHAGDVGLRDAANGFTGIGLCPEINSDIADRAQAEIAAKMAKKVRKTSLSAAGQVMASDEGDLRAEHIQQTFSHLVNKDAKRIKADNSLSDLFDGHGWPRSIAEGHLLQAAIKSILAFGPSS